MKQGSTYFNPPNRGGELSLTIFFQTVAQFRQRAGWLQFRFSERNVKKTIQKATAEDSKQFGLGVHIVDVSEFGDHLLQLV